MNSAILPGLALELLAGAFQGSFLFPSKYMKGWKWENYWLIFAVTAYLICPWLVAAATIPRLAEVYIGISGSAVLSTILFGMAWGAGALTFGLGVDAVGLALGFAVILGVAATAGAVIPLMTQGADARQTLLTGIALAIMLAGVSVCSFAGRWKETVATGGRPYGRGIALCVASGLLSACGNLGFAFGGEVSARAQSLGADAQLAGNALWTLLTLPLFLLNAGYAVYLLSKNKSALNYRAPGSCRMLFLGIVMGVAWMAGISIYGVGARRLGPLGPSLGWGILMSTMVLVANVLGVVSGEWKGAPRRATRQLLFGLALLLVAIAGLGYANRA